MLADTLSAFKQKINSQQRNIEVNVNLPTDQTEILKEMLITLREISTKLDTQHTITQYVVEETIKETIDSKLNRKDKEFIPDIDISNIKMSKKENKKTESTSNIFDIINKMDNVINEK